MEESGYKKRILPIAWPRIARGKMLACSMAILLAAVAVFLGIVALLCYFVIQCGFIVNGVY